MDKWCCRCWMSQILLGKGKDEKPSFCVGIAESEWKSANNQISELAKKVAKDKVWIHTMLRDYLIYRDCYHSVGSVVTTSRIKLRWLSASLKNMITADNLPQPSKTESNPGMPHRLGALSSYGVGWGRLPENVQVQSSTSEQASQCNCSSMDDEMA